MLAVGCSDKCYIRRGCPQNPIEHSRHRSVNGFTLSLMAGLVAYCLKESKPSLNISDVEKNAMTVS